MRAFQGIKKDVPGSRPNTMCQGLLEEDNHRYWKFLSDIGNHQQEIQGRMANTIVSRSLIYTGMRNKIGPRTLPYGTPKTSGRYVQVQ